MMSHGKIASGKFVAKTYCYIRVWCTVSQFKICFVITWLRFHSFGSIFSTGPVRVHG